jgi:hypothetical protein
MEDNLCVCGMPSKPSKGGYPFCHIGQCDCGKFYESTCCHHKCCCGKLYKRGSDPCHTQCYCGNIYIFGNNPCCGNMCPCGKLLKYGEKECHDLCKCGEVYEIDSECICKKKYLYIKKAFYLAPTSNPDIIFSDENLSEMN